MSFEVTDSRRGDTGHGTPGMRERAALLGGDFSAVRAQAAASASPPGCRPPRPMPIRAILADDQPLAGPYITADTAKTHVTRLLAKLEARPWSSSSSPRTRPASFDT